MKWAAALSSSKRIPKKNLRLSPYNSGGSPIAAFLEGGLQHLACLGETAFSERTRI